MSLFVIADTHFSESVQKPMDIFGARWRNWTEKLCENWRKTVKDSDTVILPGDISWGMNIEEAKADLKLLDSLPGKKIIGKGNHDYWWGTASKIEEFFEKEQIFSIKILHNNAFFEENTVICGSRGWYIDEKTAPDTSDYLKIVAREANRLKISISAAEKYPPDAKRIAFFHFPPVFFDFVCREIVDVLHSYDITECYYGHIHGKYDIPQKTELEGITFSLISADYLNFVPFKIL